MSTNKSFSIETSERYSRALFEVSKEANELERIETDIKKFQFLHDSSAELKNFIQNPTYNIETQNKILTLLSEKLSFSKNLKNFFSLLIKKRRIFFVKKIIDSFLRLCSKKRGEIKASLISSKELSSTVLEVGVVPSAGLALSCFISSSDKDERLFSGIFLFTI